MWWGTRTNRHPTPPTLGQHTPVKQSKVNAENPPFRQIKVGQGQALIKQSGTQKKSPKRDKSSSSVQLAYFTLVRVGCVEKQLGRSPIGSRGERALGARLTGGMGQSGSVGKAKGP